MPIIETNPKNPAPEPINPNIRPKEYRGITNDLGHIPRRALLTHIEGMPWQVEYFSQYLNADNATSEQQISRRAPYQQYARIKRMEIMVGTPLATNQDPQSREITGTGSATTYPGIIPNEGDMFVAPGLDGRTIVYSIRNVEQRSMLKDTCYTFEFYTVDYATQVRYADLLSKSTTTYVFVKDFVYTNQRPYLVESEHEFYLSANQFILDSQARYLKDFSHRRFETFLIPDQPADTYDPYITTAVLALIDGAEHPAKAKVAIQNVNTGYPYDIETVWDGLLGTNGNNRDTWATKLGLIPSANFKHQPIFASIRWSGIQLVYHALGNPKFAATLPADYYLLDMGGGNISPGSLRPLFQKLPLSAIITTPILGSLPGNGNISPTPELTHPVSADGCYVFTEAFYKQAEVGQSVLELNVNRALSGVTLNRQDIINLMNASYRWTHLDRFYYLPVLWVLMRISLAEM